jgi:hypothetical protein
MLVVLLRGSEAAASFKMRLRGLRVQAGRERGMPRWPTNTTTAASTTGHAAPCNKCVVPVNDETVVLVKISKMDMWIRTFLTHDMELPVSYFSWYAPWSSRSL